MIIHPRAPDGGALIDDVLLLDDQAHCSKCRLAFKAERTNQAYCSRKCQKNATRGSRVASSSPSQRQDNSRDWSLLTWLNETYYGTRPDERLGLLKDWLDAARAGDGPLGRVLSKPAFRETFKNERGIYFRRSKAYPPVPILADQFCVRLRDCRGWEWVNGSATEPESGEVFVTANPPPAYVVGPVTMPIEDPTSCAMAD